MSGVPAPGPSQVATLREALLLGGVALVPTDTVYGLAAALDVPRGVERLYAVKGRPRSQPCQVLIYGRALFEEVLEGLDTVSRRAAEALLPGPATCLVADAAGRFAAAAGEGRGTVGLRVPRAPGALDDLDLPLVATSANHPGGPDPRAIGDVPEDLRAAVAHALDAGALPGTASAVVDLRAAAATGEARLVRPGPDPGGVARALSAVGLRLASGRLG